MYQHLNSLKLSNLEVRFCIQCLVLILIVSLSLKPVAFGQNNRPNVIIILTDDHGYADVGFNGCKDIPTPNIDKIASSGVIFSSGYVSYAVCGPSRAGLLTGRYQDRFGFSRNPLHAPNDPNMGLPLSEQTVADYLKAAGYHTGIIGKWHMGAHPTLHPNERGFDEFFGFLSGGHQYFPDSLIYKDDTEVGAQYDGYKTKLLRNKRPVDEQEYLTDAFSREARDFIRRNNKKPFFLYLAYNAPHTPMQATQKYLDRFTNIEDPKRRTYAAMVSAVDDGVGGVLEQLEESGIMENTIVIFLSDNGGPLQVNGSDNSPLRGGKSSFFEGGVRVPFAMQWKGTIPEGIKYDNPVISLDIFATMAGIIGEKTKNTLDGVNLLPFVRGEDQNPPHEVLIWRNFDGKRYAVRAASEYKLIVESERNLLYNLDEDLIESKNIYNTESDKTKELNSRYAEWEKEMIDPVFLGLRQDKEYNQANPDRFGKPGKKRKKR